MTTTEPVEKPEQPRKTTLPRSALALVYAFVLVGGALRSVEAGCQTSLRHSLQNVWLCSVVSYACALTGFAVLFGVAWLISRRSMHWPTRADFRAMPRWAPFGGLIGGAAVFAMIALAARVGASTFNAVIIAGQMFGALVIDNFGWMGFPRRTVTPKRILAGVLIVVGIYLMAAY